MVLAFEENGSSKIGVRFDRPILDGNDLGGLCEKDHGFFCAGNFLLDLTLFPRVIYLNRVEHFFFF